MALLLTLQGASSGADPVSFRRDLAPLLQQKCVVCHGPEKQKGKFRLDSFDSLLKPGDSGEASVTAGEPGRSKLYRLITEKNPDDRMPQKDDALPAAQIALIERWIREGARFDGPDPKASLATLLPRLPHPEAPASYARPVPITALAFSPDGHELAAGGYHEITVWEAEHGQLRRRLPHLPERIHGLAWKSDGALLAIAGGAPGLSGEISLVNPATGAIAKTLVTTADVMLAVSFSPDESRLAAAGADNAVRVFDVASGRQELLIQQHADWVMAVAWSGDGTKLASASRDRTAWVYDAKSGELLVSFQEHGAPVQAVAFGAGANDVFTGGRDKRLRVWNAADEAKQVAAIEGFADELVALQTGGGAIFSADADGHVREHSLSDRKLLRDLPDLHDRVESLAWNPAMKRIAAGAHDGTVCVWEAGQTQPVARFIAAPGAAPAAAPR